MMKYRLQKWQKEGKKIRIKKQWVSLSNISHYLVKAVLISKNPARKIQEAIITWRIEKNPFQKKNS